MPAVTPEPIMRIATGFMAAKFLFVANEIGLFDALSSGPANFEELATRIAVPSRTTGIVAAAMLSLGLIEQEEGRYRNSAAAAAFLVDKSTLNLQPMLRYFDTLSYPVWQNLRCASTAAKGGSQNLIWRSSILIRPALKHSPLRSQRRSRSPMISALIDGCSTWRGVQARSFWLCFDITPL
jgi:hypothetical protein